MRFYKILFFSCFLCIGGGLLSGLVTRQGIDGWYNHLNQAPGTPPNFVFPIVWTILYLLMAISLTLVLSLPSKNKQAALLLFSLQLILNFSWSWLFFGMRNPYLALIDIIILWICLVATIFSFKKHSDYAACLLIPYLIWVSYAVYLNFYVWMNNSSS